jgi:hypothetical protein
MRRREFMALLAIAASWPANTLAQLSAKLPLIGVLIAASQAASERWLRGLPQGLQELGYVDRKGSSASIPRRPRLVRSTSKIHRESGHRGWAARCQRRPQGPDALLVVVA